MNVVPFRTHNFSLRLTDQEIASYERLARENGVSVSEWARGVLNGEVRYKEEQANLPAIRGTSYLAQARAVAEADFSEWKNRNELRRQS